MKNLLASAKHNIQNKLIIYTSRAYRIKTFETHIRHLQGWF